MNVLMLFRISSSEMRWSGGISTETLERTVEEHAVSGKSPHESTEYPDGELTKRAQQIFATIHSPGLLGLLDLPLLLLDETTSNSPDDRLGLLDNLIAFSGL